MTNTGQDQCFERRFARHEAELKWLYMELYQNDAQAWAINDVVVFEVARKADVTVWHIHLWVAKFIRVGRFHGISY